MPDIYISGDGGDKKNNNGKKPQNNAQSANKHKFDDTVYTGNREFEDVYSSSAGNHPQSGKKTPPNQNGKKMPPNQNGKKTPPKKKKKKRVALKILAALLAVIVLLLASGFAVMNSLLNDLSYAKGKKHKNEYIAASELMSSSGVKNILLIGVDSRDEVVETRSDTMMIVSINSLTKEMVLTSFMRDLYVDIPDNGSGRLNAANVYGGPELLMDTIEYNFKIDVDNYALITFDMFKKLIDAVGGIEVDISEAEAKYMHGSYVNLPKIKAGKNQLLNGREALWYCRIRKLDSDFNRTERQREVVTELMGKLAKTSPGKLYDAAKEIMPLIKTDLTKKEVRSLASYVPALYAGFEFKQLRVPADDTWRFASKNGASVIVADGEKNVEILKKEIYGE